MQGELKTALSASANKLFGVTIDPELTRPEEKFGDYSTNLALQIAKKLDKDPRETAQALTQELEGVAGVEKIDIAGPGFINFTLTDEILWKATSESTKLPRPLDGQEIVVEYSDPNPFKMLHAGHLYTSIVGDSIANLLQGAGANVHRVNFGGDVGLHVGKSMWAIIHKLTNGSMSEIDILIELEKLQSKPIHERAKWLSDCYTFGNEAYENNAKQKEEIITISKRVYHVVNNPNENSNFADVYKTCREWSYEYFKNFYKEIHVTEFDKYYLESETAPIGLEIVRDQLGKGVFEKSDGAVVFKGEKYGLHTRVFITAEGLPTYETKDIGLITAKKKDYRFDRSIVITGNDIVEYMRVVLKAVEQFQPDLVQKTTHITHGMVKLVSGIKMSSRKGNIVTAMEVIENTRSANREVYPDTLEESFDKAVNAAVKYSFLKQRIGADIIYDPRESVSIEGSSGPYLQYAYARACAVLAKVEDNSAKDTEAVTLDPNERSLARKISEYPEIIERATADLMPHHIATYLYELAQTFNRFYENSRIIGDERQALRLQLTKAYAGVLKSGLDILNISAPERI